MVPLYYIQTNLLRICKKFDTVEAKIQASLINTLHQLKLIYLLVQHNKPTSSGLAVEHTLSPAVFASTDCSHSRKLSSSEKISILFHCFSLRYQQYKIFRPNLKKLQKKNLTYLPLTGYQLSNVRAHTIVIPSTILMTTKHSSCGVVLSAPHVRSWNTQNVRMLRGGQLNKKYGYIKKMHPTGTRGLMFGALTFPSPIVVRWHRWPFSSIVCSNSNPLNLMLSAARLRCWLVRFLSRKYATRTSRIFPAVTSPFLGRHIAICTLLLTIAPRENVGECGWKLLVWSN